MKTIEQKFEQTKRITTKLSLKRIDNTPERTKLYYSVLKLFNKYREEINIKLNNSIKKHLITKKQVCYFDLPELRITSTTYERAKKRMMNDIDNRFMNR